jgi:hypothetical protein
VAGSAGVARVELVAYGGGEVDLGGYPDCRISDILGIANCSWV